ncbi:N-acetylmuramoyl-L-alanine amidase family protein [Clostridium chromiireducens]|uniref:Putative endo-beta-N-acetylglucosaminidase n=1 Tax=Clostridium chromiireducens TaxID=225345 RepID=A0A1V4II71_9CLOT|nr:cadherin-like beta sandwich domain-containing protein [Clostridium chromiireducens]OPJ59550.1 putative endo-beta-N-acetylglucosaminidase precursor [Clostridium chromiireducens]
MNIKIKRLITITLAINALMTIQPTKYINLTNEVEANAAINTNLKLKDLYLSEGKIDFDSEKTSYNITVKRSIEEVKVTAKPKDSEAIVEIDGSEVDSNDNYERKVSLDKGENTITIKLSNGKSKSKTYTIDIRRGTTTEDEDDTEDDEDENIYLSDITLSDGEIEFSKETKSYTVNVDNTVDKIEIKAKPEDSDYTVKVDGETVYEDDKYEKTIELNKGNNNIEIYIKDGTKENTYELNIIRGKETKDDSNENTSNIDPTNVSTSIKTSQWVQVNNKWQYNDATGKSLLNTWFYDKNFNKNYYLQSDGTMATGWLAKDSHWYYFDSTGAMQTGWEEINSNWYYFDLSGIMQTGWIKDSSGKYYHLKEDGSMAKNTTINGYKLGLDGAWIGNKR